MSDAQERPSRVACAKWCDTVFAAMDAYPKHWTRPHIEKLNAKQAAAYLRVDGAFIVELERMLAEAQNALYPLRKQVGDLRRVLEWCRVTFAPDMQAEEWYSIAADLTGVGYETLLPEVPNAKH